MLGPMTKASIKERLQRLGRSQADLARHLGLDASAVSRLLKGERQLKGTEAVAIAGFLGCDVAELLDSAGAAADGFMPQPVEVPQPAELQRNLPVYGAAIGGVDGAFALNGQHHEFAARPPQLAGVRNAYGVYVNGDSMHPMFQAGWLLHVNPNRPLTAGCGVVVQVRAEAEEPPLCYIKEFVRRSAGRLVVRQYNPAAEIEWPLSSVIAAHRVVGIAEM